MIMKSLCCLLGIIITLMMTGCQESPSRFAELGRFPLIDRNVQMFDFCPGKDTTLVGAKGTRVIIPKGVFSSSSDAIYIRLELQEFYSLGDFILAGLSTMSGSFPLSSDGMVNIEVYDEGKKCSLKNGASIQLEMPTKRKDDGMDLFWGSKQSNGTIDWIFDGSPASESGVSTGNDLDNSSLNPFNVFKLTKLGWINCDRFLKYENKSDLLVTTEGVSSNSNFAMVFEHQNSVMFGRRNEDASKILFKDIPAGEYVSIIGFEMESSDEINYRIVDVSSSSGTLEFPKFETVKLQELQTILASKFGEDLW